MTRVSASIVRKVFTEIVLVGAISILVIVVLQAIRRHTVPVRPSMKGPLVTVRSRVTIVSVQFSRQALTLLPMSSPLW